MIIVRLTGGLGNQLFQYAMGRATSLRTGYPLYLDTRFISKNSTRVYSLDKFKIAGKLASEKDYYLMKPRNNQIYLRLKHILKNRLFPPHWRYWITYHEPVFNDAMMRIRGPAVIKGYWQDERYFRDYEAVIRKDLVLYENPSVQQMNLMDKMRSTISVSMHIRRGDYAHEQFIDRFGILRLEYYKKAMKYIQTQIEEPTFYVFADDMEWAKNNIDFDNVVFLDFNGLDQGVEDLQLMSSCRHHIIANSTFSWWGAWLNPDPNKIVIAPKPWFKSVNDNHNPVPDHWINLASKF
jgi:hypothetical protein